MLFYILGFMDVYSLEPFSFEPYGVFTNSSGEYFGRPYELLINSGLKLSPINSIFSFIRRALNLLLLLDF